MPRCDLCHHRQEMDDMCVCEICGDLYCARSCGASVDYRGVDIDLCADCQRRRDGLLERGEIEPRIAEMYYIELETICD